MTIKQLISRKIEQIPESELEEVYQLIQNLINQKNNLLNKQQNPPYHDLDYLAGTWTQEDETEFIANIAKKEMVRTKKSGICPKPCI